MYLISGFGYTDKSGRPVYRIHARGYYDECIVKLSSVPPFLGGWATSHISSCVYSKAVGGKEEEFADLEIIAHFAGAERRVMTKQRFLAIVMSREQTTSSSN